MTTYIGAHPLPPGSILFEPPRKPIHRCVSLEALRDQVAGEHKEAHRDDYLAFAEWFPQWWQHQLDLRDGKVDIEKFEFAAWAP